MALRVFLAILMAATLNGCSAFSWFQDVAYKDLAVQPLDTATAYSNVQKAAATDVCIAPATPADESKCESERNTMVTSLINTADTQCIAHVKTIYGNQAATAITFGTLAAGAAGAATVFSQKDVKNILAAFAAFFTGDLAIIETQVYQNQVTPAIINTIIGDRLTDLQSIQVNETKAIKDFNIAQAMNAGEQYNEDCSFVLAISKLVARGEATATAAIASSGKPSAPTVGAQSAAVAVPGTAYAVNDVLTVLGGTSTGKAATFTVTAVNAGGVQTVKTLNPGAYTSQPTNPASVTGGTGNGATLTVTYQ